MKKTLTASCLILLLLTSCEAAKIPVLPSATIPPTQAITLAPTIPVTPVPTFTLTPLPTSTSLPPVTVDFYHLRIEYTSTSDWASLDFTHPENILSVRQVDLSCSSKPCSADTNANLSLTQINLYRPVATLGLEPIATLIVDLALAPAAVALPFGILSKHGGIKGSDIRISYIDDGQYVLLKDLNHTWLDPDNPDTSAANFPLDLTPLQSSPSALQRASIFRPDRLVLAFYYPWFPGHEWDDAIADKPMIDITSSDPASIAWQIDQAKTAGIDGFVTSYASDWSDDRTAALLKVAEQKDFKISFLLEAAASDATTGNMESWIERAYQKFTSSPAFLKVDGKPVMFIYCSGNHPLQMWQDMFTRLRGRGEDFYYLGMGYDLGNLSVFDGVFDYGTQDYADLAATEHGISQAIRNDQLLADPDKTTMHIMAATIGPGFDSTPYGTQNGVIIPRDDGQYYLSLIDAALQSDPDWIMITSWNEYGENTHIEPSQRDGYSFLEITRDFVAKWKGITLSP